MVLLITIDCVRFDVMHDAAQLEQWPAFKALIERSVDFTDAHTPAPATAPALSTIYTGKYYSQLVWKPKSDGHRVQLWPAEDPSVRFPGLLTAQKIPNIFFASEDSLRAPWGVTEGFEQTVFPAPGTAPALVTATLDWLAKHPDGPAFVAIHILDPHWPYVMGGEEGPPKARYLAEIGTVDRALGGLFDGLDRLGLTARTVVIVTADHGEAFGEHGSKYHGANLYEVVEHVPLLVSVPGLAPRAEKTPVGGVDLGPTILDLFHQGTPTAFLGESLLPLLRGEPSHLTRPIVADSGRRSQGLYFPDGLKVTLDLRKKSVELFDLVGDPAELNNLFNPENPDHRARLAKLKAFFQAHEVRQAGYETPFRP